MQAPVSTSPISASHVLDQAGDKKHSLWRVSVVIMAIVFGPAALAWVVTLIH